METKLTLHINNLAYTFRIDEKVALELSKNLQKDKNLSTEELLSAVVKTTQKYVQLEDSLNELSSKLPKL